MILTVAGIVTATLVSTRMFNKIARYNVWIPKTNDLIQWDACRKLERISVKYPNTYARNTYACWIRRVCFVVVVVQSRANVLNFVSNTRNCLRKSFRSAAAAHRLGPRIPCFTVRPPIANGTFCKKKKNWDRTDFSNCLCVVYTEYHRRVRGRLKSCVWAQ